MKRLKLSVSREHRSIAPSGCTTSSMRESMSLFWDCSAALRTVCLRSMSCGSLWHSFCWPDTARGNRVKLRRRSRGRREMKCRILPTLATIAFAAAVTLAAAPPLQAQSFPSEPITLIVAWPAGGGSDISMRLLADALSKQIKVPVVVLNKPGAGGAIGHREIVNAKPDGYTIGMFSSGGIALPYLNAQANTFDELQPIAFFGEDPSALQVSIASGIGSLKEYVERARANPGKIKNGNDQPGGSSYIAVALYEKRLNIKVTRVSYAGFGPTVIGLMAGEVDSATVPVPDTIEQHRAGKLKILGVSATEMAADI